MKTKTTLLLTGAGFIGGYLCSPAVLPSAPPRVLKDRGTNSLTILTRPQPAVVPAEQVAAKREEEASFAQWEARFAALLTECGTRDAAAARLLEELDQRYLRWVSGQLASLENTPYADRVEALGDMTAAIRDGAAAVLEHLEIPGGRSAFLLAASMEALSAEMQYGMAASTHEQRLALLRLDRERDVRMGDLLASSGDDSKVQAMNELDSWYDARLREVSGSDEIN